MFSWRITKETKSTQQQQEQNSMLKMFNKHKPHATQAPKGPEMPFLSLVTLTFDLWPWHSKLSEKGTKHVFPVNFVQIRSAVCEVFHTQTKKSQRQKQNLTQFSACGNDKNTQKANI